MAGFGVGVLYYGIQEIWKTWKEYPTKVFGKPFEAGSISIEDNPALLGVGYIIGPRIASIMVGGGVLSYLVLVFSSRETVGRPGFVRAVTSNVPEKPPLRSAAGKIFNHRCD